MIAASTLGRLGDEAGVCPPRPTPKKPVPSAAVRNLQRVLQALAKRVGDSRVSTVADGLIGPNTARAVNYAMPKYGGGPAEFRTGKLTARQVAALAPQLASYLTPVDSPPAPAAQPSGEPMPYYQPQMPSYDPAPVYYGQQPVAVPVPAGLPPDQASLDVRAFIPAQYDHIRINPSWVMVALGVGVAYLVLKNKEKKGRD